MQLMTQKDVTSLSLIIALRKKKAFGLRPNYTHLSNIALLDEFDYE